MISLFGKKPQERLHLIVFKDDLPSKTLDIPMSWISKLGLSVSLLVAAALISIGIATRLYWVGLRSSPGRVLELEKELSELRGAQEKPIEGLENTAPPSEAPTAETAQTSASQAPITLNQNWVNALFTPETRLTPIGLKSIDATELKLRWQGKSLKVTFNIQYVKDDGGNQQGRILILARGPSGIRTYPEGILSENPNERGMIDADEGERFSVSRFRGVLAEFGPFENKSDLQSVSIFLFDTRKNLLFFKKVAVTQSGLGEG